MAVKPKPFTPLAATTARRQLAESQRLDARQRQRAKNILKPEVISSRTVDAAAVLMTTLGGQVRPITERDLKAFQKSALALGKKYAGGITCKKVIAFSLDPDKDRARRQIHTAFPTYNRGGLVQFQTNAGPDSKKTRHQVLVEFSNFTAAVVTPAKTPAQMVRTMIDGPIKIECDCEHWRYVYRYIATVGRFNAGRAETGFPKLKNPQLEGIACKHVLRVMQVVSQTPTFGRFALKMIERARAKVSSKIQDVTKKQAKEFIAGATQDSKKTVGIESSRQLKEKKQLMTTAQKAIAAVMPTLTPAQRQISRNLSNLVKLGVLTPDKAKSLMKNALKK